jgi:HAUS augmin-like complex subunit 1
MASLAIQTNTPLPTPPTLGAELISLTTQSSAIEQTISRIQTLTAYIAREAAATATLATTLRPPSPPHPHHHHDHHDDPNPHPEPTSSYHPPPTLALQNLTLQRQIKTLTTQIPTLRDKAAALARSLNSSSSGPSPSIPQLRAEEEAYLALLALKQDLDAQVRAFQGLPPDTEQARHELEGLRAELRRMTITRDEVFEGLVERETPRKGRG